MRRRTLILGRAVVGWVVAAVVAVGVASLVAGCSDPTREATAGADGTADYLANAERWVRDEFQPSTLSTDEQLAELQWFV